MNLTNSDTYNNARYKNVKLLKILTFRKVLMPSEIAAT